MGLKKRLIAAGVIVTVAALTFGIARSGRQITEKQENTVFSNGKETLYLWYTDEALTSYLGSAAVSYNETHDVRVVPVLEGGPEYLENINRASLETDAPDLYILGHDSLEKAYLAGLADEVEPTGNIPLKELYMDTGLQAAIYEDKLIGYPFYFETSVLLYNKSYLEQMAVHALEAEAVQAAEAARKLEPDAGEEGGSGEEGQGSVDESREEQFTKEQIEGKIKDLIPATIEEIRNFADSYDAPEQVEGVFKWDVTDIFYNYFFVGNAINMGGEAGWDTSQIDIYNQAAIKSLRVYQDLNQFFSIDTDTSSYESIMQEFMEGKMVFTIATSDAVSQLEQARAEGSFPYEYGFAAVPDINDELKGRSLSMTACVVINGYSGHKREANDFARFLTSQNVNVLYGRTGKVSAARDVDYEFEGLKGFATEYERSISMPKMLETSNFWVLLESAFSEIWNGADANEKLKSLSEQTMRQVTGEDFEEEYLEEEPQTQEEEYVDGGMEENEEE